MILVWEHYQESEEAFGLSNVQKLSKVYELVTFQPISELNTSRIKMSVEAHGVQNTFLAIMDRWYSSSAYTSYFDYRKAVSMPPCGQRQLRRGSKPLPTSDIFFLSIFTNVNP